MTMSTATTPSEDVVREILLRLDDVAALFRCATTCKRWRRLVAKPFFLLGHQWPPSLAGFFTCTKPLQGTSSTDSARQLAWVPLPGSSLLGTRPRADAAIDAAVIDRAVPLATRGGLLLVRLYLRVDDDRKPSTFSLTPVCNPIVGLAVCNTLSGTWDVLPELNCQSRFDSSDMYGCDIVPSVACDGSSSFKVIMVGKDKDKSQYNLHIFDAGEASWRAPAKCFDMMERQVWSLERRNAVVCRGYAHWLFYSNSNYFHILSVDVETGHATLTKLLSPRKEGFFPTDNVEFDLAAHSAAMENFRRALSGANRLATTADGTRLSLYVNNGRRLEVWTEQQEDEHKSGDDDAEWRQTRVLDHKLTDLIGELEHPSCIWLGSWSDTMLIRDRYGSSGRMHIAHLNAGTLEEATDLFGNHARNGIMPVEIDWPAFFMSRLGGS